MGESLLAVGLGGLIAILSGIAGPIVQHFLGERTKTEEARRANVISLILALYELGAWLEKSRENQLFSGSHQLGPSPMATVEALIRVHFPNASLQLAQLGVATAAQNGWVIERTKERLEGKPLDLSGWKQQTRDYALAQNNLIAAIAGGHPMSIEDFASFDDAEAA